MLIITKKRYKKQHVIGGSGIFDTVVNLIKRVFTSGAAKAVGLSVAKQAGRHLVDKMMNPAVVALPAVAVPSVVAEPPAVPAAVAAVAAVPPAVLSQKSRDDLTRMLYQPTNINNLMQGSGVVAIQDLVKRLRQRQRSSAVGAVGTGMKIV